MTLDADDLGDAKSRAEARNYGQTFERKKSDHPEIAYLRRWVPTGSRRMSLGDLIAVTLGILFLVTICGMHFFGVTR
jgi:hypothetical protein